MEWSRVKHQHSEFSWEAREAGRVSPRDCSVLQSGGDTIIKVNSDRMIKLSWVTPCGCGCVSCIVHVLAACQNVTHWSVPLSHLLTNWYELVIFCNIPNTNHSTVMSAVWRLGVWVSPGTCKYLYLDTYPYSILFVRLLTTRHRTSVSLNSYILYLPSWNIHIQMILQKGKMLLWSISGW